MGRTITLTMGCGLPMGDFGGTCETAISTTIVQTTNERKAFRRTVSNPFRRMSETCWINTKWWPMLVFTLICQPSVHVCAESYMPTHAHTNGALSTEILTLIKSSLIRLGKTDASLDLFSNIIITCKLNAGVRKQTTTLACSDGNMDEVGHSKLQTGHWQRFTKKQG